MTRVSYKNEALQQEITVEGPDERWVTLAWNKGMRLIFPDWNYRYTMRDSKGHFRKRKPKREATER